MQMANMGRLSGCHPPLSKPVNRESKANIDPRKACTMQCSFALGALHAGWELEDMAKDDARAVALRDLLLFFAFNLTWPGRVEVGWHETSQSN